MSLRVAVDGLLLWGRYSGVERSIASLAAALPGVDHDAAYSVYLPSDGDAGALEQRGLSVRRTPFAGERKLARIQWQQLRLPGVLRRDGTDVLLAPGYVMPLRWAGPSVLVVYDLIALTHPELAARANAWHYRVMLPRSVRRATRVVVPTAHVRAQVVEHCGVSADKVVVVPLGVDAAFHPITDSAVLRAVRTRFHLPEHFLLYLGNLEPKKNLPRLLKAFAAIRREGLPHRLVLAGAPAWGMDAVRDALEDSGVADKVLLPGYVADADLPALYTLADLLVFPSLTEGFGLPPLEAMACGTPALVADAPPFPETVGDAAIRVDPRDPDAIAAGLRRGLRDDELRGRLREAGLRRAAGFTWERTAARVRDVLHEAAEDAGVNRARRPATSDAGGSSQHPRNAGSSRAGSGGAPATPTTGMAGSATPSAGTAGSATPSAGTAGSATPTTGMAGSATPSAGTAGSATPSAGTAGSATPSAGTAGSATPSVGATSLLARAADQRGPTGTWPPQNAGVDQRGPTETWPLQNAGELAYLLGEFPSLSETFILREMQDLIGRGLPLRIYALRPPRTCRVHADAAALRDRVTYRPRPGSLADLRAHLRVLYHQPGRYLALLSGVLLESRGCPARLRQKLVALDAAICMASPMRDRGTGHLHAHFAGVPTTAARYASRLLGIPFSFTAHARDIYVEGRQDRPGLAASLKQAAFAVTCTEYNREYLTQRFPQVPAGKIHRVYHGIDPDRFAVRRERDAGPMRILAVGRLQRKKGLHVLFEACGILHGLGREFTVIIAGDGPEKERLTRLAQERGIQGRVLFLGEVTQEEILPAYASADVLALPCLVERSGDRDGLPNVILEALAAGLAVVTTPVSGIPEVIEEGVTGLLVPSEDPAALAAALERLMDDPDLARRLGEAGRERVRRDFDLRNSPLADLFAAEAGIAAAAPAAAAGARNGRSRHSPVAHS